MAAEATTALAVLAIDALPRFAQDLVRVIGYGATMEMILNFGGNRLRFAKTEGSAAFQAVAEVIGAVAARQLAEAFGDQERAIPTCYKAMKNIEKHQIVARFESLTRAPEKIGSRAACNQLAREFKKTYRAIEIIVNSPLPVAAEAPQQAVLF